MTKTIELTQGKVALVDDADYEWLSAFKWHYDNGYAARQTGTWPHKRTTRMHREIMSPPAGSYTDHINGDKLDNRRVNLRICNMSENQRNRGAQRNNTTGFKGVSWHKDCAKWVAWIRVGDNNRYLGLFATAEDAARAYDAAALKFHGEFARTNREGK